MLVEEFRDRCLMLDLLWHLNGMNSAFLCNLSACCLPSCFCSRGYMVWKMMVFKEMQDFCLVHGYLWYLNAKILAILSLNRALSFEDVVWRIPWRLISAWPSFVSECNDLSIWLNWLMPTIKALPKRTYGLEDVVWRISRWLFSAWPFVMSEWDDLSYSEFQCCLTHSIKFLLETIYGLRVVVCKYQDVCLVLISEWNDFIYSEYPCCMMHPKFLLKRIYGLEEVVWKIPKRLFIAWPYFVSKWNERSIYESLFGLKHPIKFLLMRTYSLEEDNVWQISRLLFRSWPSWYLIYSEPPCLPGFCSRGRMVLK